MYDKLFFQFYSPLTNFKIVNAAYIEELFIKNDTDKGAQYEITRSDAKIEKQTWDLTFVRTWEN